MSLTEVRISAPGKINLTLDVLGTRPDGYHDIASIMQTISLADEIVLAWSDLPGITLTVTGPQAAGVPTDERNLAAKAATRLLALAGVADRSVTIILDKRLPLQAGLGGGSSDAAAVLIGVNRLLDYRFDRSDLLPLGKQLGADVSFFLYGGIARVGGIGDVVEPIASGPTEPLVLVKPLVGVSTAAAYGALDTLPGRSPGSATERWPYGGVANDFEAVVYDLAPEIADARDALLAAGAHKTLLCGSGATVAGIGGDAYAIAEQVRVANVGDVWIITPTNETLKD